MAETSLDATILGAPLVESFQSPNVAAGVFSRITCRVSVLNLGPDEAVILGWRLAVVGVDLEADGALPSDTTITNPTQKHPRDPAFTINGPLEPGDDWQGTVIRVLPWKPADLRNVKLELRFRDLLGNQYSIPFICC